MTLPLSLALIVLLLVISLGIFTYGVVPLFGDPDDGDGSACDAEREQAERDMDSVRAALTECEPTVRRVRAGGGA